MYYSKYNTYLYSKYHVRMKIEEITRDGRLWSIKYDEANFNALELLFEQWEDVNWLKNFFTENIADLSTYFKITNVDRAIFDTIADSVQLQCLILDISPDADLDKLFRPLENSRTLEMQLGREKAKVKNRPNHASWLRIYAIKLEPGVYIVTGGAIKLTATMQERQHTLDELKKMNLVRSYLLSENIFDAEGLADYLDTQNKTNE